MSKLAITTISIALLTASGFAASNKAQAAGHEDPQAVIEKLQQEKSVLFKRLNNAVAYSKDRAKQIEALQAKADAEQERRVALSSRLNNVNAFAKTSMDEVAGLKAQVESEQNKRKILSKRLRNAIAVSKARGADLASAQSKNQSMSAGISSALAVSKKRSARLAKAQSIAESQQKKNKILSKRLRNAIAVSKARRAMLESEQNKNEAMRTGISSALAVSKKRSAMLAKAQAMTDSQGNWASDTSASLNAAFGGIQGTTVSNNADGSVTIQVGNNGLFNTGSTIISASGNQLLATIAQELAGVDGYFTVVGHTDNIPVGNSNRFKNNKELSFARAVSTLDSLSGQGINTARLSAAGYGDDLPIADNNTPEGRQQNRRVDIILRK